MKIKIIVLLLLIVASCKSGNKSIIGVKIYENNVPADKLISMWNNLGINTAFTSVDLLSDVDFRKATKDNNITTFVILPIFFDAEILDQSPELYAITAKGEKAEEDWVKFVCPSQKKYRNKKILEIKNIVEKYDPDGISLDFIRHFVFWEMVYPNRSYESLPNTCFCELCMKNFQKDNSVSIPEYLDNTEEIANWIFKNHSETWITWKCELITSMINEITSEAKKIKPDILVNVHIVPWLESDFNNAIKKVAGQDISAIASHTNYLSPMTYSHMVKQNPSWIHEIVKGMNNKANNKILPSIQVSKAYLNTPINKDEFESALTESLKPPSKGVVFWSWERLVKDSGKMAIVKNKVK